MKKILLIIVLWTFSIACYQNKSANYGLEVEKLKVFVEDIYKNDSAKVKTYVKNDRNGKIFLAKTNDPYSEFDFDFSTAYNFIKKDDKIIYISKMPVSQSGDSSELYEYYFDENKRLIGAKKSVTSFYGENGDVVEYTIEYLLSSKTDKLERTHEYYTDMEGKIIDSKSKRYKMIVKNGLIENYIESLDSIIFRDLETFMKTEKIKFYK